MSMPDPNRVRAFTHSPVFLLRERVTLPLVRCMLLLMAASVLLPGMASAATYRVGAGGGCTHVTIQAAVNAAASNPGFDTIRIARSLGYSNQNILVQADTAGLEFIGGYADCQANTTGLPHTVVSGAGGATAPVFSLRGTATIFMQNLEITGGDNNDGGGGGIQIIGGPKTVLLTDMLVRGNQARFGGGISAVHTVANTSELQLLIGGDTSISGNTALEQGFSRGGGGLYCEYANVRLYGNTFLLGNVSNGSGGGIDARYCTVDIGSAGLFGGVLMNNYAARSGGGLSAIFGSTGINIYTVDPEQPATLIGNTAGDQGGAILLSTNARVSVYDAIIRDNVARSGGAVAIDDGDGGPSATRFLMQGATVGAPAAARNCAMRERCNRISGNAAQINASTPQPGAALWVNGSSGFLSAVATLRSTRLDGNRGQTLIGFDNIGDVSLDGALIEGNTVTGPLFDTSGPFAENLVLAATTIAGNSIGAGQPVIKARNACAVGANGYSGTHLYRSIVWQPGHALVSMNGTPNLDCFQYLLSGDLAALPASPLNRNGDPQFVDAAAGNYRLRITSPALDYAFAQTQNATRDLGPRLIDDPTVLNAFGAHDLGAYEIDTIFADGFEYRQPK